MGEREEVSVRERVKQPPSAALIAAYFAPTLARQSAHGFDAEIWCHLAHAAMLARQGIISQGDTGALLAAG